MERDAECTSRLRATSERRPASVPPRPPSIPGAAGSRRSGAGDRASEAELDLLHRRFAATRDARLRDDLVRAYAGFARSLARRFPARRERPEDLVQVALIGLLHAVDHFDPERDTPFLAFASASIFGHLKRHLRDNSWFLKTPRRLQQDYLMVMGAAEDLTHARGRSPTVAEIAEQTDLSEEEVLEAMEVGHARRPLSLDAPSDEPDDASGALGEQLGAADPNLAAVEQRALLHDLLARLPERDRLVLHLRFEADLTQAEIAARLGINQMYVSRVLTRTFSRLRGLLEPSRRPPALPSG